MYLVTILKYLTLLDLFCWEQDEFFNEVLLWPEEVVGTGGWVWVEGGRTSGHARAGARCDHHSGPARQVCTEYALPLYGVKNWGSFGVGEGGETSGL